MCEAGVCNPADGECVECVRSQDCGRDGVACRDNECVEVMGADRASSDWGDGNDLPFCEDAEACTEDEDCIGFAGQDSEVCLMPCDDAVACPNSFVCCAPRGDGQDPFCIHEDNGFRFLCQ